MPFIAAGKAVKRIARLRGGGSALPGLLMERLDPGFLQRTLGQLPHGVVLISGTNGKTTTTKMVVALLESQGLRVFTNPTGSNFVRGIMAALLDDVDARGNLDADIAVLELDEAHAIHFIKSVQPRYSLLLNVMRDQLDRFGEIDYTAQLLHTIAAATTEGVVLNRDDPRLGNQQFADGISAPIRTYGVSEQLQHFFPSDDSLHSRADDRREPIMHDDTALKSFKDNTAVLTYQHYTHIVDLKVKGIYNLVNAVGAVALVRMIMGDRLGESAMLAALSEVRPAFGRGETIMLDGQPVELVLVKNPAGFRLSLASFRPAGVGVMIAINDQYADGRDMSWLWDVDFSSLAAGGVDTVSGVRAYDMALRLQYDAIELRTVSTHIAPALRDFLQRNSNRPTRIFCSYTAMLAIRRELGKMTNIEAALS
ncbi:Mur ligase [Candidatus Saccharibacteria bacterium]|nr:MAG: Mur ligase [Candidatus Saccharibacteria bacterium]